MNSKLSAMAIGSLACGVPCLVAVLCAAWFGVVVRHSPESFESFMGCFFVALCMSPLALASLILARFVRSSIRWICFGIGVCYFLGLLLLLSV